MRGEQGRRALVVRRHQADTAGAARVAGRKVGDTDIRMRPQRPKDRAMEASQRARISPRSITPKSIFLNGWQLSGNILFQTSK